MAESPSLLSLFPIPHASSHESLLSCLLGLLLWTAFSSQDYHRVSGIGKPVLCSASRPPATSRCPKLEESTPRLPPPLIRQFSSVVATGQVLRELNQVPASGECPSRPWRARAKSDLQLGGAENLAALPPTCQGALALSGVLRRLQQVEEKVLQKRAQNLANREFHKKNIKEKAAHLASMFGHGDFPQDKLLSKRLLHSHPPSPPSCLPSPDPAAPSSPPAADSVSPARKLTVGKVSSGIGAAAEVLVNLYLNDHRPKTQATSPDLVRKCTSRLHLKTFAQPLQARVWEDPKVPFLGEQGSTDCRLNPAEAGRSYIFSKTDFTWVLVFTSRKDMLPAICGFQDLFNIRPAGLLDRSPTFSI